LIIGTYRDADVDRERPLFSTLGVLARYSQQLPLLGLPAGEVAHFIEETTGIPPSPHLVSLVHEQTEGNPFFLSELVQLFDVEGQPTQPLHSEAVPPGRIPQGVRETLRRRLLRLTAACTRTLSVAAVIGREFSFDLLAQVHRTQNGREWEALLASLQEALR